MFSRYHTYQSLKLCKNTTETVQRYSIMGGVETWINEFELKKYSVEHRAF